MKEKNKIQKLTQHNYQNSESPQIKRDYYLSKYVNFETMLGVLNIFAAAA